MWGQIVGSPHLIPGQWEVIWDEIWRPVRSLLGKTEVEAEDKRLLKRRKEMLWVTVLGRVQEERTSWLECRLGGESVGGDEAEENHTGPVGSCLGPARSRGMTGSGLLFSISGCFGGNGMQRARVEVKRAVRSYSRGSKWDMVVTWPKVMKVEMEWRKAGRNWEGCSVSRWSRSSFLLLNLAFMCCWRNNLWMESLADSFIQPTFIGCLVCGRSLPGSSFREGYEIGSKTWFHWEEGQEALLI